MLAAALETGFFMWGFYASQPYLLDLLESDAVWVAGLVTAGIAGATIVGNELVQFASRFCGRRTTLLLWGAGVQSVAAVVLGLTGSFWVALPALLCLTAGTGVVGPVRQAYLHQVIPSEQRATVVSFDSMVSGAGGVGGQLGLGALGEARSVGAAFVVGGVAAAGALPHFAAVRRIPRVSMVEGRVVGEFAPPEQPVRG
jgi:MFS family permease